jgi:transforming growth factor-beta-induced protein
VGTEHTGSDSTTPDKEPEPMRKPLLILGLVGLLTTALVAPAAAARPADAGRPTLLSRAVAINAQTGEFSTLLSLASQYPDIVAALQGKTQLTLFAPTAAAFDDLFAFLGTLGVQPSDLTADQIKTVLLYHVTAGRWSADRLAVTSSITMLSGESAAVSATGGVTINASNVVIANVPASNGFIHAIDAVLVPPSILAALGL